MVSPARACAPPVIIEAVPRRPVTRREFLGALGALVGTAVASGGVARAGLGGPGVPPPAPVEPICKEAWGAAAVRPGLVPHTIERLTVHHTAAFLSANTQAPYFARRHQTHHQNAGWPDLAYHFLVDAHGHVYEGRPHWARGDTFTSYDPTGHFLVSCQGSFSLQRVTEPQLRSVVALLAWAAETFDVSPTTIGGHRDYAATVCPGDDLYRPIADGSLRRSVERRLGEGSTALVPRCGPEAAALVEAIEAGNDEPLPAPGRFLLKYRNRQGNADAGFDFGEPGWLPVGGRFGLGGS